jgi:hypothetical protein
MLVPRCGYRRLLFHLAVFNFNAGAHFVFGPAGTQLHLCHGRNRSQCLAPETHGADMKQVIDVADLGSGVPFKAHAGIGFTHAGAVIHHLYQALPASFTSSLISVAPASTAFSSSSFTALAGRWITSPAAIWLAILSGQFIARFDSSAIYRSLASENQYDINKLYGFSDNADMHHQFSARFGWSWTEGKLWLYGYVYNDGVRTSTKLCTIPLYNNVPCEIQVKKSVYEFWVEGQKKASMPRAAYYLQS